MFVKDRKVPLPLLALDALIARLIPGHPKLGDMRQQAARYQKGYNGERKLDYHLRSLPERFAVLNDVGLTIFGKQFQIDSLIVTSHAIYILEVKSFEGTVTFDTGLKQFIQANGEKLHGRKYPITQVENIQFHFLRWLQMRGLAGLPFYYYVLFAEPSTIIKVVGDEGAVRKVVFYVDEAPLRLMKADKWLTEGRSGNNQLKNRVVRTVMEGYEDFQKDMLREFDVDAQDILPGVACSACGTLGMVRLRYRWRCGKCGAFSRDAHLDALCDWALLFGKEITNRQCRDFLGVGRSAAHSLLSGAGLSFQKGKRVWLLDIDKLGRR